MAQPLRKDEPQFDSNEELTTADLAQRNAATAGHHERRPRRREHR